MWLYLNFNDSLMAVNTLFGFIWLNNWQEMLLMYQLAFNHQRDGWVLFFFISFFMLAAYLILNILVAFVIDVYTSIDSTLRSEQL
jgi:hypothetical protein